MMLYLILIFFFLFFPYVFFLRHSAYLAVGKVFFFFSFHLTVCLGFFVISYFFRFDISPYML